MILPKESTSLPFTSYRFPWHIWSRKVSITKINQPKIIHIHEDLLFTLKREAGTSVGKHLQLC